MPDALYMGTKKFIEIGGRPQAFLSLVVATSTTSARILFSDPPENLRSFQTMASLVASYLAFPVDTCDKQFRIVYHIVSLEHFPGTLIVLAEYDSKLVTANNQILFMVKTGIEQ